jgi:hypothetical protein
MATAYLSLLFSDGTFVEAFLPDSEADDLLALTGAYVPWKITKEAD